ncbi:peroxiredoxin family protein [Sinorhizobium medicae]|uniref:peroxiredoxin family protein n=1 Tax=Sinorhizobium medicae TaxID=110321 RepID=UPI0027DACED4|nr:redoxin domain-containing protein [Sinorhizobium medicae]
MSITQISQPVTPGEPAPDFVLPAVDGSGTISLADYRGRTPLFLALFIGLWCPFCRRAIAQIAASESALKSAGVETLGVVATAPDNAQLYFRFRPTRLRLAADPELSTIRRPKTHTDAGVPEGAGYDPDQPRRLVRRTAADHACGRGHWKARQLQV